jgi:hypothetical protein
MITLGDVPLAGAGQMLTLHASAGGVYSFSKSLSRVDSIPRPPVASVKRKANSHFRFPLNFEGIDPRAYFFPQSCLPRADRI